MCFLAQELDTRYWTQRTEIAYENRENKSSGPHSNNPKSKGSSFNPSSLTSGLAPKSSNSNSSGSTSNPWPYADKLGKDSCLTQEEKDCRWKNNLCMFCGGKHKTEDCNKHKAMAFAKGRAVEIEEPAPASEDPAPSEPENWRAALYSPCEIRVALTVIAHWRLSLSTLPLFPIIHSLYHSLLKSAPAQSLMALQSLSSFVFLPWLTPVLAIVLSTPNTLRITTFLPNLFLLFDFSSLMAPLDLTFLDPLPFQSISLLETSFLLTSMSLVWIHHVTLFWDTTGFPTAIGSLTG